MTQLGLKPYIWMLGFLLVLLFSTGILKIKPDGYACIGGWDTGFQEKTILLHFGPLHIYGYPFTRECPEDRRYDPNNVDSCISSRFCRVEFSDEE